MVDVIKMTNPTNLSKTSVGRFIDRISSGNLNPKLPDERLINIAAKTAKKAKLI